MNWSRRQVSAESVASTNEPLMGRGGSFAASAARVITNQANTFIKASSINNDHHQPQPPAVWHQAHSLQQAINNPLATATATAAPITTIQQQQLYYSLPAAAPLIAAAAATATNMQEQQQQSFSEWWDEYWSRQPFPSGYTQSSITLLACFISTIIFLIVVGNLLVCIAIFTEKSLKPTQNWFIASLAVSDMLLGLVVMPFSLARELMGFWVFGPLWCDIHEAVDVLLTTASINTLCLISLDRYWSITQAVSYLKKRTPRRGAFMIAFVWVFSAAVSLPPLFGWKKQQTPIVIPTNKPQLSSSSTAAANSSSPLAATRTKQQPATDSDTIANNADYDNESAAATAEDGGSGGSQRKRRKRARQRDFSELATPGDAAAATRPGRRETTYLDEGQQNNPTDIAGGLLPAANQTTATTTAAAAAAPTDQTALLSDYPTCQLSDDLGYVLYSALGSFYIPCAVMVFTYIKIFLAARSRARRTINKQGRGGGANKRATASAAANAANRRAIAAAANAKQQLAVQQGCNASTISGQVTSCADSLNNSNFNKNGGGGGDDDDDDDEKPIVEGSAAAAAAYKATPSGPIMKGGKIVIVERKKSLAAFGQQQQQQQTNSMSSSLAAIQAAADRKSELDDTQSAKVEQQTAGKQPDNKEQHCTLTTSGVKHASPSALNSSASNDSSMITVMHSSMVEVPQVTRFNFRDPNEPTSSATSIAPKTSTSDDEGSRKAAALLDAIRQVSANEQHLVSEVLDCGRDADRDKGVPDIVVERRETGQASQALAQSQTDEETSEREAENCCADGLNATSETCFMTIEEDSDMFESQTGRTITMVASNATQRQTSNLAKNQSTIVTMMPAAQTAVVCSDAACRSGHRPTTTTTTATNSARSASSYCGSSMTINDDDIDECDNDDEEDEPLTDECNGYSCSVGYDHYCPDQDLSSTCGHCQECEQADERQATLASSAGSGTRNLSIGEALSPVKKQQQHAKHHHHHHQQQQQQPHQKKQQQQQQQHKHTRQHLQEDTTEVQSIAGDDNLSLTEYRSNEDEENSSIIGHDVLDATDSRKRDYSGDSNKKQQSISGPANAERKKSSIGFRLARLGSSAPLSNYSGGLLALASNSQQQQQQQSAGGARNLKALRQNFFLKLNQLTAKSAPKQQQHQSSKSKRPASPTGGKSSGQSSGTSYEPSVDYATTSNIHSNEYPQETTMGDESEQHSSGERATRVNKQQQQQQQQRQQQQQQQQSSERHNKTQQDLINGPADGDENGAKSLPMNEHSGQSENVKFARHGDKTVLLKETEPDLDGTGATKHNNNNNNNNNINQMVGRISSGLVSTSKSAAAVGVGAGFTGKSQRFDLDNHHPHHHHGGTAVSEAGGAGAPGGGPKKRSTYSSTMMSSSAGSGQPTSQRAYLASDNERHKRKLAKARERRATLILGLIMAAFICSWLPFFTFYVLRAVCSSCKDSVSPRVEATIFWMGYCNSAINPIIYTIFNRDFRKAFRKILFKCL